MAKTKETRYKKIAVEHTLSIRGGQINVLCSVGGYKNGVDFGVYFETYEELTEDMKEICTPFHKWTSTSGRTLYAYTVPTIHVFRAR